MSTGRPAEAESTGIRDDGSKLSVHIHVFPTFELNGEISGFIEVVEDISDRKKAEQKMLSLQAQLQQSQKMEAIGRLAGGIAHDFNNLLTVISVQSQFALRGLWEGDPLKEKLKDIEQAAGRAENLTRQLLAFSRRQILEIKVVNLNHILKDMEKMLRRVIGEDIELKVELADDLGMVKVDPVQMEQVILNLVVNAKDAMPQGGKLSFETANAELDEEYFFRSHAGMIPGSYVILSITDTGVGMTKEVREHIFEPFFTTKEKGKGTGLGLSTVYGIVKQSGGYIYAYGEPNKGTTFKIYLPQVFEPAKELAKEVTSEEIPRGNETILVVEDDPMVRRLAVDILRGQGYTVLEAEAGGDALLISEQYKEPIHLILTDVVMPHMSGAQLIERLKQVRKDFTVLYMTGHTDEAIIQQGILEKGINLIHKPFTLGKLGRKVRKVLDKK
jgi:signal transduction histidine kinase